MDGANRVGVIDADLDDIDATSLWAESGAAWLTDPGLGVPVALVRRVVGVVADLDRRGAGLVDISHARGLGLLAERAAMMGLPRSGEISAGGATRFVRAADGWLAISLARDDDHELLPAWLDGADDPFVGAIARRSVAELVERATLLGLPCAGVDTTEATEPVLAERLGDAPPRSIEGALVVDLSALWAGPLCADVLARAGARLVTVESTRRPDGGRQARRFFAALHGRSESVALDLGTEAGRQRLAGLVGHADVVIEGSRPRALEQMGVDAPSLLSTGRGPQVWISITAHGRAGDAGQRVGFGDDAAAAGGLVGWVDGEPRFVADAVADPLTGLTAAATVFDLVDRGGRWLADVALARVARSVRPDDSGWVAPPGAVAPQPPRSRTDPGATMPLGRDTERVLAEFGLDGPDRGDSAALG